MGLKEEIREELEEKEKYEGQAERENCYDSDNDLEKEFHGIGWNILHKKFIEDDF